jgi:hypothetical protein
LRATSSYGEPGKVAARSFFLRKQRVLSKPLQVTVFAWRVYFFDAQKNPFNPESGGLRLMSDEACGLWVDVWTSILVEELPRLGRAIASVNALKPEYLTDSERQHVRDVGKSAMLQSPASLETLQAMAENPLYHQMLASAERVREDTRRAAQEIERIVASKGS